MVDGQAYYLNDTDQYAKPGTTAHANRLGLTPANGKIMQIKPAKNCGEESQTLYTITLTDDGQAQIGITRRYFGSAYNAKKHYFAELPPEERRRYFQQIVSSVAQGARPVGDLVTQFDSYPGIEQFSVTVDHYAVVDGKYFYFDLPFRPSMFPAGSDARVLPLFIGSDFESRIATEISLPPEFSRLVIAPSDKKLRAADAGSVRVKTSSQPGKFLITQDMEINPAIIPPDEYPALLNVESTLGEKSGRTFLLEKK
jgi:hypothetical protein